MGYSMWYGRWTDSERAQAVNQVPYTHRTEAIAMKDKDEKTVTIIVEGKPTPLAQE